MNWLFILSIFFGTTLVSFLIGGPFGVIFSWIIGGLTLAGKLD